MVGGPLLILLSNYLDEDRLSRIQLLSFAAAAIKPTYSNLSSPLGVLSFSILLPLCLYPLTRAYALRLIIMDPFFGWTAAALAAYLAGRHLTEDVVTTSDRFEVPSPGLSVRCLAPSGSRSGS